MAVRWLLGFLMMFALLSGAGCCSWCEKHCPQSGTCCAPATCAPAAYAAPAPVYAPQVHNGCTCTN